MRACFEDAERGLLVTEVSGPSAQHPLWNNIGITDEASLVVAAGPVNDLQLVALTSWLIELAEAPVVSFAVTLDEIRTAGCGFAWDALDWGLARIADADPGLYGSAGQVTSLADVVERHRERTEP
jgi:hypothetical protein